MENYVEINTAYWHVITYHIILIILYFIPNLKLVAQTKQYLKTDFVMHI